MSADVIGVALWIALFALGLSAIGAAAWLFVAGTSDDHEGAS